MLIVTIISALFMGTTMGFLGGGGSILSVPLFIYVFKFGSLEATSYSLLCVGLSAFFGALRNFKLKQIDFRKGVLFAIPSSYGVMFIRGYVLPLFPNQLGVFSKDDLIVYCFILFLIVAGTKMLLSKSHENQKEQHWLSITFRGLIIGVLTGFVGAGGGFLIVPSLNLLLGIPIKIAIGTSLFIISINSTLGFISSLSSIDVIAWETLMIFLPCSIVGVFFGQYLTSKVDNKGLKNLFGYFVILMAVVMIGAQVFKF